jgi:hypothetical protein
MAQGWPGRPVDVKLVVDHDRCTIEGVGPIPVTTARKVLQDASIALLVRDGDAVSRPVRAIPAKLRRELETDYPACGGAGLRQRPLLEIDHVVPICEGGATTRQNTWRICTHHHFLKHHRAWTVTGAPGPLNLVAPESSRAPP